MTESGRDEFRYPTTADLLGIHEDIVAEYPGTTPGVEDAGRLDFALDYVADGHFGEAPETVHEKAFHLLRLLVVNHWFADANKRTALNATWLFYALNGYEFDYGEDLRSMLKLLSVREGLLDPAATADYFADVSTREMSEPGDLNDRRAAAKQNRDEHREVYDALADE